jgi:serine/threonine protein kinase
MIIKKIGDGSFAQAWVAKWHMANVAVKIMSLDLDTFRPEFNFNCMLHHPNVVRFLGAAVNNQIGQVSLYLWPIEGQMRGIFSSCSQ